MKWRPGDRIAEELDRLLNELRVASMTPGALANPGVRLDVERTKARFLGIRWAAAQWGYRKHDHISENWVKGV